MIKSKKIGKSPVTGSQRGVLIAQTVAVALLAAEIVADAVVGFLVLPAGHRLVRGRVMGSDLDTDGAPAVVASVGVVNATEDDLVANTDLLTASTVFQAGGVAEFNVIDGLNLGVSDEDRVIGVKFDAGAATGADGSITMQIEYAADAAS